MNQEKLGHLMVRERLISEAQLNTALDFQRATGGKLSVVIDRLGFTDAATVEAFYESIGYSEPEAPADSADKTRASEGGRHDKTVPLPRVVPEAKTIEPSTREVIGTRETPVVLDALLRLLVRKGVITTAELTEEFGQSELDSYKATTS